jgi:hypothetical protein
MGKKDLPVIRLESAQVSPALLRPPVPIMAYAGLALANASVTSKGAKMAVLTDGPNRCHYTFKSPTRAPFGPSNFDKDSSATRQNLEIRVSGEAAEFFDGLDDWALTYITAHSERLFKKKLSLQQVRDMYHPCLRRAPGYDPLLRTKYNAAGSRGACRFWTLDRQQREPPVDWREAEVTPHVHISHLWMMGQSCGLVVNLCDMLVTEATSSFPFGQSESDA